MGIVWKSCKSLSLKERLHVSSAQLSQAHHLREKNVEEKPTWVVDTVRGPELIVFVEENKEEEKKRKE